MKRLLAGALALLAASGTCRANGAEEEAGLALADSTPIEVVETGGTQVSVEGALRWATNRPDSATDPAQRLSIDLAFQRTFLPGLKFVFADRLDLNGPARFVGDPAAINTLKELYVSGRIGDGTVLADVGRINMRLGVATGFNPSDYFREDAVRSVVSVDPASLRENRLGTMMARGQAVWSGGSVTALVAPRLADEKNDSNYAIDLGATNRRTQWLVAGTARLVDAFSPQWLLYGNGRDGDSPQLGWNATALFNQACVGFFEWTGGRRSSTLARALGRDGSDAAFRSQLATGATCTASNNLSLTLEYDYNGAALDSAGWRELQAGPPQVYAAYRTAVTAAQEPATRNSVFAMIRWQNAFMPRLDLSGFMRFNVEDRSRLTWVEARYRFERTDLALQWQISSGAPLSEFGAMTQQRLWQVLLKHYF